MLLNHFGVDVDFLQIQLITIYTLVHHKLSDVFNKNNLTYYIPIFKNFIKKLYYKLKYIRYGTSHISR